MVIGKNHGVLSPPDVDRSTEATKDPLDLSSAQLETSKPVEQPTGLSSLRRRISVQGRQPASLSATAALRSMTQAQGEPSGAGPAGSMPEKYDASKARSYPNLREACAPYHVKENYPNNVHGFTRWNTGKRNVGEKTQRKLATLNAHRERIALGGEQRSLMNVIGHYQTEKSNTIVVLFDKDGKAPSFYGIHPQDADGKHSWFPMDPDDENIPAEYRKGETYRLGGTWGDEPQYDSDDDGRAS